MDRNGVHYFRNNVVERIAHLITSDSWSVDHLKEDIELPMACWKVCNFMWNPIAVQGENKAALYHHSFWPSL